MIIIVIITIHLGVNENGGPLTFKQLVPELFNLRYTYNGDVILFTDNLLVAGTFPVYWREHIFKFFI